jgi:hypothetical protein
MKDLIALLCLFIFSLMLMQYCESKKDPYKEGMHLDYHIMCVDGFKYKVVGGASFPCYNSDGTKLKCNQKRY